MCFEFSIFSGQLHIIDSILVTKAGKNTLEQHIKLVVTHYTSQGDCTFKIELFSEGMLVKDSRVQNLLGTCCSYSHILCLMQVIQNKIFNIVPGSHCGSPHNGVKLWNLNHVYNPGHKKICEVDLLSPDSASVPSCCMVLIL